jgi:hypothetical protein
MHAAAIQPARSDVTEPGRDQPAGRSCGSVNTNSGDPAVIFRTRTDSASCMAFHRAFQRGRMAMSLTTSTPPGASTAAQDSGRPRWAASASR